MPRTSVLGTHHLFSVCQRGREGTAPFGAVVDLDLLVVVLMASFLISH